MPAEEASEDEWEDVSSDDDGSVGSARGAPARACSPGLAAALLHILSAPGAACPARRLAHRPLAALAACPAAGGVRVAVRRFLGGFDEHGMLDDAGDEALSGVDAREAARRATDPINAIDIASTGEGRGGRAASAGACGAQLQAGWPTALQRIALAPTDSPLLCLPPSSPAVRQVFQQVAAAQPALMQAGSEQLTETQMKALKAIFPQMA